MIFQSHLLSMIVYSFFVCVVLALIRRNDKKARLNSSNLMVIRFNRVRMNLGKGYI